MGLRGPLAAHKLIPAETLDDLTPPDWLDVEGRNHWERHAEYLTANKLLTFATADSFAMACDLWSRYKDESKSNFKVSLSKQYTQIIKQFRMLPTEKPGAPEERHEDKEEFDFDA